MRRALIALATTVALLAAAARPVQTAGGSGQGEAQALRTRLARGPLTLRVGLARGGGYRIVTMRVEDYVAGVLAGEAAPHSPPAALDALAVAVRTFAVANLGRHASQGFDLCDQTHCQVYRTPTADTRRAADATAGEVLFYDGAPASVFYSAWCGGYTERPSEVWPGAVDEPYLPSKPDPAAADLPGWSVTLRDGDLLRALHAAGFRGRRLRNLAPMARDVSGRVVRLRLDGLQPDVISGQDLRVAVGNTLGWQYLKSTAFSVRRTRDGYEFRGKGSGHGVGLCVLGSVARAQSGQSADAILQTYFPGTQIVTLQALAADWTAAAAGTAPVPTPGT
ncbi:MAG: SpoIID/LytB domain-containing protein, partial [Acidobacteriota bacterium]|nr:SpoIID/LytB domain-containing protein [Acidobacteriota bacterium]